MGKRLIISGADYSNVAIDARKVQLENTEQKTGFYRTDGNIYTTWLRIRYVFNVTAGATLDISVKDSGFANISSFADVYLIVTKDASGNIIQSDSRAVPDIISSSSVGKYDNYILPLSYEAATVEIVTIDISQQAYVPVVYETTL